MRRFFVLSSFTVPLLCFGAADSAYAYIQRDSTDDKYYYSERRFMQFDEFTTATGSLTTFDRRAIYLRAAQQRRVQEDLDARVFGESRPRPFDYLQSPQGQERFRNTALRRLAEAQQLGGIRIRSQARAYERMQRTTAQERDQQVDSYRQLIREVETARFNPTYTNILDCYNLARRRQASCLHELRTR